MAVRTIAAGGGNWNATATWMEGIVPVLGDDVFAVGTSGQLTVNVASACTSINFTNYTNTLTMNATLSVGGSVTLVAAMTIAGTGTLSLTATGTITSNGVIWPNSLFCVPLATSAVITLADDWTIIGGFTLTAGGTSGITINNNTLTIGGSLTASTTNKFITGTTSFILNGTGSWAFQATTRIVNNLTINTTGTITIGTVEKRGGTFTYIAGKIIATTGGLTFSQGAVLINMDKIPGIIATVTAGNGITMNKFFSGSPKQKTTIQSSVAGTAITITFQDNFEKTAKFVKVSDCSLTRKGQLLMLTPNSDKGGNSGIRYINQSPNGIAKNAPSVVDPITYSSFGLVADPCFY